MRSLSSHQARFVPPANVGGCTLYRVWRTLGFARAPHDRRPHELDLVGRGHARPQAQVFL
jgi:hypothetical protein